MRGAVLGAIIVAGLAGPALAQSSPAPSQAEMRELIDAAKATAKASRENVDYSRTVPDILTQILAKLDKLENKLDKVENAIKAQDEPRKRR